MAPRGKKQSDTDGEASNTLRRARIARDAALHSITKLAELGRDIFNEVDKCSMFEARFGSLERFVAKFEKEQEIILSTLIEMGREDEFQIEDMNIADCMEVLCGEIGSKMANLRATSSNMPMKTVQGPTQSVILPKIEIPKFDGEAVSWCSFRDMFKSLVHDNRSISNIERFHYLLSCLSGSALTFAKSLPLTEENYIIAWNSLNDRFENKRLLATAHLDKLFAFTPLSKESKSSLSSFVNIYQENVAAIKNIGVDDLAGFLLFYIGARRIDPNTRMLFEANVSQNKIPDLEMLLEFASHRIKILENVGNQVQVDMSGTGTSKKNKGGFTKRTSLAIATSVKSEMCKCCKRDHPIYRCFLFKKKPVSVRRELVATQKLCYICLQSGHMANACTASLMCKSCNGRHNTLLHIENIQVTANSDHKIQSEVSQEKETTSNSNAPTFVGTVSTETTVLLGTASIRVFDNTGVGRTVRALLDSGSQISAITTECAMRLGLTRHKQRTQVVGLAQQPVKYVKGSTRCTFVPISSEIPHFTATNVIILPKITSSMPHDKLPTAVRDRYDHLQLADPDFDVPGPIDMLIGGDIYPLVLQTRADIIHNPGLPSALNTRLGWIVIGSFNESAMTTAVSLTISPTPTMESIMQQFWATEEPQHSDITEIEDDKCEEWFTRTVSRDDKGRFSVALPFKIILSGDTVSSAQTSIQDASSIGLGSSRSLALNRLYNLERRLRKDVDLYTAYRAFMEEYIALGHMKRATRPGEYFIPHHAVVKRNNNDIKIRVVFDASAPSSSGRSLNDCLATGPKLQADITDILLRNRFRKYIFVADIAKMYRQIEVCESDRVFQHILWRSSPHEEVQEYELCTITYGVNAAPFLALRCLRQLDNEHGPEFPLAQGLLATNTYVDDIIAGADSVKDILILQIQVNALLKKGCFELKKWASNCLSVLDNIKIEDRASDLHFEPDERQSVKVLGVYWDPARDTFGYRSTISEASPTKRNILSTVARLYDPIGALGPMVFWAKCIMQDVWCQRLDWDTAVSKETANKWQTFLSEIPALSNLFIPRYINITRLQDTQLIGFSDASKKGYAATVYIRLTDEQGSIQVHFLTCKSKVAPLKSSQVDTSLTIPRLELCAAVLLARVLAHTLEVVQPIVPINRVRAFSDSTIVLSWLKSEPKDFKIFVNNRISMIKKLLPQCDWSHVRSKENAADPASRGLLPHELVECKLHLDGSEFLSNPEHQWPDSSIRGISPGDLPEYKHPTKYVLHIQCDSESDKLLHRFSSFSKMQRVIAYCFRFSDSCRKKSPSQGAITYTELNRALVVAIKMTQNTHWSQLHKQLMNTPSPVTPTNIAQLAPFLDSDNVIRVGGRLQFSSLSERTKHPILLPKAAHLSLLIIRHFHLSLLHAGPKLVMTMIYRRFWIVSGRAAIRHAIHSCIRCVKHRAVCPQPIMADLPAARVHANRPFSFVGMDYGGPFIVKESRRRNAKTSKAYLSLFICMSTKAVHLELVSDLSTDAFIATLNRFIARRGIPVEMFSDCGTNYVGAARQIKALFRETNTQNAFQSHIPCKWNFNPPAAPHFGGLWEAAIKSAKTHLKRVIGSQILTMEEMMTLVVSIEGILNSRPLTALSSSPNDSSALTPGHFLIGQPILALPEHDLKDIPMNRLDRWRLIQQTKQSFWSRWSREYLHTLQARQKWYTTNPTLTVGDVVIINSPNLPVMSWQMGRVIEVHPGADQVVRVVTVKTAEGVLKRPVVKLVKLPVT